jgi:hypothetical protein
MRQRLSVTVVAALATVFAGSSPAAAPDDNKLKA